MDTKTIIAEIDNELARLKQVRALLSGAASRTKPATRNTAAPKEKRRLSVKARKAIAEAQRKRWAKVRRAKKAAPALPKQADAK